MRRHGIWLGLPLALACWEAPPAESPDAPAQDAVIGEAPEVDPELQPAAPERRAMEDPPAPTPPPAGPTPPPEPTLPPETAPAPAVPAPEAEKPPEPELELKTLTERLKQTKAIGVFAKLELKNQIDRLFSSVRDYHERGRGALTELRERFELLVMKVLSLLQEDDPELAGEVASSRAVLWETLADPVRFAQLEAQ